MTINEEYEVARNRAGGRCEWVEGFKDNKTRCIEIHGEPAKTYKGKCILLPNIQTAKIEADNIRYFCLKHSNEMDKKRP